MRLVALGALALMVLSGTADAGSEPPVWPLPFQLVTDTLTMASNDHPDRLLSLLTSSTGGSHAVVSDEIPGMPEDEAPVFGPESGERGWIFDL